MMVWSESFVGSVYVHAPFCSRRCIYCDFAVTVNPRGGADEWLEALRAELDVVGREGLFTLAPRLDTVYVGGGTPSLLGPKAMEGLRDLLGEARLSDPGLEWTAEANPESFTAGLAAAWVRAGVNRVSIGVQTFHEPTLRWMGRLHGPEGPQRALLAARRAGLGNVSVDLVFGLPSPLGRSWAEDLERTLELDVPHVSLYGLSVEPATPLGRAVSEGREPMPEEDRYRNEFLEAAERLSDAGYVHYEVSNFARPGYESRHNAVYWEGGPYLGLGNGAHSYRHPVRRWNVRDWSAYRERVASGLTGEEGRERLDAQAEALERTWLGLRTREGLSLHFLGPRARFELREWERAGLATLDVDRVCLTPAGWLELDHLAVELDTVMELDAADAG